MTDYRNELHIFLLFRQTSLQFIRSELPRADRCDNPVCRCMEAESDRLHLLQCQDFAQRLLGK
ncbi:MAG: hypothetical protein NTZ39_11615 [Methanoregula sp.]|nr:hypothetical protein [Methanoregula sp.]